MKLVKQGHEIISLISPGGVVEMQNIEVCGRKSYLSHDHITSDGESAKRFIEMVENRGHESVIEHSLLSVGFTCSRGVSHEIVRHRLFSITQESTRYCNYSKGKFGSECIFIVPPDQDWGVIVDDYISAPTDSDKYIWWMAMSKAEDAYMDLLGAGMRPEQARDVLPNALKTEMAVSGNYREWRHFFQLRTAPDAHPHIRALAKDLLEDIKLRIPVVFDDL